MKKIMFIAGIFVMASVQIAMAHGDHQMKDEMHNPCSMGMKMDGGMQNNPSKTGSMFLEKKEIDGYTVSFHVMAVKEGIQHGGSHNLMIKVEKDGTAIGDLTANSKVTHPNGKSESKMMMKMGDWYMAGYDLGHKGDHQLMVLFKTSDGVKHFGGVHYSEMISAHEKNHSHEMANE